MNTFYFLLVLMTVKGTKSEFTLDCWKTLIKMKKLITHVIYFPTNPVIFF